MIDQGTGVNSGPPHETPCPDLMRDGNPQCVSTDLSQLKQVPVPQEPISLSVEPPTTLSDKATKPETLSYDSIGIFATAAIGSTVGSILFAYAFGYNDSPVAHIRLLDVLQLPLTLLPGDAFDSAGTQAAWDLIAITTISYPIHYAIRLPCLFYANRSNFMQDTQSLCGSEAEVKKDHIICGKKAINKRNLLLEVEKMVLLPFSESLADPFVGPVMVLGHFVAQQVFGLPFLAAAAAGQLAGDFLYGLFGLHWIASIPTRVATWQTQLYEKIKEFFVAKNG